MTVTTYRRLLHEAAGLGRDDVLRAGETVGARLDEALVEELDGLAAGSGQDVRELLAINARTELLAGGTVAGECSLLARREPVGRVAGADLGLASRPRREPRSPGRSRIDGGWFTTVTEAGVLAKLGHNGHGVACGLNFLTCSADGGLDGVPIHVLLRLVLERCVDGADARALLGGARTAASSCITVAAGADLFAAELSPGGAQIVEPDADGWLVHTNHFLLGAARGRRHAARDASRHAGSARADRRRGAGRRLGSERARPARRGARAGLPTRRSARDALAGSPRDAARRVGATRGVPGRGRAAV